MKFDGGDRFSRLFMINDTTECVLLENRFILIFRAMMLEKQRWEIVALAPVKAPADLLQTGLSQGKALTELGNPLFQRSYIRELTEFQSKAAVTAGQAIPADFLIHGEGETIGWIKFFQNIFLFYAHPF
jgi:hypothetical protein